MNKITLQFLFYYLFLNIHLYNFINLHFFLLTFININLKNHKEIYMKIK